MSYLYTSYSAHKETELSVEVSQRDINYSIQFRKYNLNSVDSNCWRPRHDVQSCAALMSSNTIKAYMQWLFFSFLFFFWRVTSWVREAILHTPTDTYAQTHWWCAWRMTILWLSHTNTCAHSHTHTYTRTYAPLGPQTRWPEGCPCPISVRRVSEYDSNPSEGRTHTCVPRSAFQTGPHVHWP